MKVFSFVTAAIITTACSNLALGSAPTAAEITEAHQWTARHLHAASKALPFSFVYDGKPSGGLLGTWPKRVDERKLDDHRMQRTLTWTDPRTGLVVQCVAVKYADYPVVEWTVYVENAGRKDTPILQNVQGLDSRFERGPEGEFVLNYNSGDWCREFSYEPHRKRLGPGASLHFAPVAGRPTSGRFPYYNLLKPNSGVILAVGWPGQWASTFTRDRANGLRIVAGQELTSLYLRPGETIRTPLTVLMFWHGSDVVRAQNLWRRWFMAHNIPKINGKPPAPILQIQLCRSFNDGADVMQEEADKYASADIDVDLYWRDAGWYPTDGSWTLTGTWEVDQRRFPQGFKPISNWIHARGKKLIVWFEPERVAPGSRFDKEFPEWLLHLKPGDAVFRNEPDWLQDIWVEHEAQRNQIRDGDALFNLGNEQARAYLTDLVSRIITEEGIDYYRQDFNIGPLLFWQAADAPDRQGMTENLYVQGYLAFWDELRRRHPDMLIDSCSSGGRRNDLETMRRSVPLLRSDFQPAHSWEAQQSQTYGIAAWLPYYGSGTSTVDKYAARSYYLPSAGFGPNQDMKKVKALFDECRKVAPYMLADYYPLCPYSLRLDQWMAWQFNRPEQKDGIVQVFRRDKCDEAVKTYCLRGLIPTAQYEITNFDVKGTTRASGKDLMEKGLKVKIAAKPGAAILSYRRVE